MPRREISPWHRACCRTNSPVIGKPFSFRLHVAAHEKNWHQAVTDAMHEFPEIALVRR